MSAQRWVARSNREVWTSDGGTSETRVAVVEGDVTMERAHLIAAAPDLLAALREAVTSLEYAVAALQAPERCAMRENIADARAAIAKAEGRS